MFTRADKDGDGKLTKEEWLSVLNSSGVPTTRWEQSERVKMLFREEVEEFFNSMDRDFDGRLSFEEFMGEVEIHLINLVFAINKNADSVVRIVYSICTL